MKQQYHTPTNTYIQFRFQDSLRKYQKPPTKKIKCSFGKCHHCNNCNKKNHQISKAQRINKITSARKYYAKSNQKQRNSSIQHSPLPFRNVSDFNLQSNSNYTQMIKENVKQSAQKYHSYLSQNMPITPMKKNLTCIIPCERQNNRENYYVTSKQNCYQKKNSINSKQQRSSHEIASESNSHKTQQFKNIKELIGDDIIQRQQEDDVIGNVQLKTEQKKNALRHLQSILREKQSPLADYIFQMFDQQQYCYQQDKKQKQRNKNIREDLDTPFSKIYMSMSVSHKKSISRQVIFDMEVQQKRQFKKNQTSSFIKSYEKKNDQIMLANRSINFLQLKKVQTAYHKVEVQADDLKMDLQYNNQQKQQEQQVQRNSCLKQNQMEIQNEVYNEQKINNNQISKNEIKYQNNFQDNAKEDEKQVQEAKGQQKIQQKQYQQRENQQQQQKENFHLKSRKKRKNQVIDVQQQRLYGKVRGHIKISSGPVQCLLSLRVLKKFIQPFENIQDIVSQIINQRPYLQLGRQSLRDAVQQYLNEYQTQKATTHKL